MKIFRTALALPLVLGPVVLAGVAGADPGPTGVSLASAVSAAEEDEPEPEIVDKRPEIEEALDALAGHIKKRGREDREAVALVEKLAEEFARSGPKDRKAMVKGVSKCLSVRRDPVEEGVPDNRLFKAAAEALGSMEDYATKDLVKWIDHKKHEDDLVVQRALILSLGRTRDKKAAKPLVDLLQHPTPALVAAAAEALGEFEKHPSKLRKEVFYDLLKVLMALKATKDAAINDPADISGARWDAVQSPIRTSLRRLSGEEARDPEEWQKWWNDNKRRDWDEPS